MVYTFVNGTTADADEVTHNFNVIYNSVFPDIDTSTINYTTTETFGSLHGISATQIAILSKTTTDATVNIYYDNSAKSITPTQSGWDTTAFTNLTNITDEDYSTATEEGRTTTTTEDNAYVQIDLGSIKTLKKVEFKYFAKLDNTAGENTIFNGSDRATDISARYLRLVGYSSDGANNGTVKTKYSTNGTSWTTIDTHTYDTSGQSNAVIEVTIYECLAYEQKATSSTTAYKTVENLFTPTGTVLQVSANGTSGTCKYIGFYSAS